MAARDNLSSQFWGPGGKMFHISPVENRGGIEKEGLRATMPGPNGLGKSFTSNVPGVFVSERPHSFSEDMDVYVVDTSNTPAIIDDAHPLDRSINSRFVPGSIPPSRVQRLTDDSYRKAQRWAKDYWEPNPFE